MRVTTAIWMVAAIFVSSAGGLKVASGQVGTSSREVSVPVSDCVYAWNAKYARSGSSGETILVRVKISPTFAIDPAELTRLKDLWRQRIVGKWSEKFPCRVGGASLKFEVEWVSTGEHHRVRLHRGNGRANMGTWYTDNDPDTPAHEYGHMVGIRDEYVAAECPTRRPVNTSTVMEIVTGPTVQRHINAVCGEVPSAPLLAEEEQATGLDAGALEQVPEKPEARAGGQEAGKAADGTRITADDVKKGDLKFTYIVAGGPAEHRVEFILNANGNSREASISRKIVGPKANPADVAKANAAERGGVTETTGKGKVSEEMLKKIQELLVENDGLPKAPAAPILPDSMVGVLTIEANGKKQRIVYPLDEQPAPRAPGQDPLFLMKDTKPYEEFEALVPLHENLSDVADSIVAEARP